MSDITCPYCKLPISAYGPTSVGGQLISVIPNDHMRTCPALVEEGARQNRLREKKAVDDAEWDRRMAELVKPFHER